MSASDSPHEEASRTNQAHARRRGDDVTRRAGLTIALLIAAYVLRKIQLPDVDGSVLPLHVGELGILPATSAFLTVEIAALLVPRWGRLRHRWEGRERLNRASLILTVVLAAFQGFGVAMFLEGLDTGDNPAMADVSTSSRAAVVLLLTAGAALHAFIARTIGRVGIGNGFSLLLVMEAIFRMKPSIVEEASLASVAPGLALSFFVATMAGFAMGEQRIVRDAGATRTPWKPRLPASGLVPVTVALTLPAFLNSLRAFQTIGDAVGEFTVGPVTQLGTAAVLVVALTYLFNPRRHIEAATKALFPDESPDEELIGEAQKAGAIKSVLLALLVLGIPLVLGANLPHGTDIVFALLVVVVFMDLRAEFGFRRDERDVAVAACLHRPWVVDLALDALARKSIPAVAKGTFHRTLLQVFGPYVPVEILVPAALVEDARDVLRPLENLWGSSSGSDRNGTGAWSVDLPREENGAPSPDVGGPPPPP